MLSGISFHSIKTNPQALLKQTYIPDGAQPLTLHTSNVFHGFDKRLRYYKLAGFRARAMVETLRPPVGERVEEDCKVENGQRG
jgi:hypothetical protein